MLCAFILLLFSVPALAQTPDEINALLTNRIDEGKQAVGLVVGIIDADGRQVFGHGRLSASDPRELDGQTLFEIGPITKVFTSLLLADMVERGEVQLDDPVAKCLPESVKMPARGKKPIEQSARLMEKNK